MELICALDLLDGRAVRLEQGRYDGRVADGLDAVQLAARWSDEGARRIHVVDLEGARRGEPAHLPLVTMIVESARSRSDAVRVELGGGLRREEDVAAAFMAGADEVILGSAAIRQAGLLRRCAARWRGRILASLDLRDGRIALDGWTAEHDEEPLEVARRLLDEGASRLLVTDVRRDGTLAGPNMELLVNMRRMLPGAALVAAGGVRSLDDLRALEAGGIDGAIVGLALLTGQVSVPDALATLGAAA